MKRVFFVDFFFFITEKNINTKPHEPFVTNWGKCRSRDMFAVLILQRGSLMPGVHTVSAFAWLVFARDL